MTRRRKVSAAHTDFVSEADSLLRLDAQNQQRFHRGPGRPSPQRLTQGQLHLLTESIFLRAFSTFESYLEDVFLLYTCGKKTKSGTNVGSYIVPRSVGHARDIVKSQMRFIDWNSPSTIIARCDLYLSGGNPIKIGISTHLTRFSRMRKVRNAIAHKTQEAESEFAKVVRDELRVAPIRLPAPGDFLNRPDPSQPSSYFLVSYLSTLKDAANICAG